MTQKSRTIRTGKPFKIGFGYDSHRFMTLSERRLAETLPGPLETDGDVFDPSRPLLIGGVPVSEETCEKYGPFVARSDGDLVFHAAVNAVLSALGDQQSRDIGTVFPNTDRSLSGMDSSAFLSAAASLARDAGYAIEEIKVTVKGVVRVDLAIAAQNLKLALGPDHESCEILVQGTSGEGIGFAGRGEGMEAYGVCLLARSGLMEALGGLLESRECQPWHRECQPEGFRTGMTKFRDGLSGPENGERKA